MATPNYSVNYEDERFDQVEADKADALTELEQTYDGMIGNVDDHYDKLIENTEKWGETQSQLQKEQTEHTIDQINQQKDQAHKDYVKEQSGAYVDWQKQSNAYGSEAEKMASAGLANTGFSESSQVSMYNTYQNRVAVARESYNKAVLNYDNAIKDAQLQNNALLAEIAFETLQKQLELSLEGFQYKNQLILEKANKKVELNNTYYNRYLDVLNQINQENALAEDVRQFNETMAFNTTQAELNRQHESTENELNRTFQAQQAELDRTFKEKQAELDRKHEFDVLNAKTKAEKELLDKQHAQAMAKLAQQHKYEQAQLEKKHQQDLELAEKQRQSAVLEGSSGTTKVIELGLGPISDEYLARLVAAGLIDAKKTNKGIVYTNTSGVTRQNADAMLKLAGY